MADNSAKTILVESKACIREAILAASGASASVSPGNFVKRTRVAVSGTNYDGVSLAAAEEVSVLIAIEDDVVGNDLNDAYAAGSAAADIPNNPVVRFAALQKGDIVFARYAAGVGAINYDDGLGISATGTVEPENTAANVRAKALGDVPASTSEGGFVLIEIV